MQAFCLFLMLSFHPDIVSPLFEHCFKVHLRSAASVQTNMMQRYFVCAHMLCLCYLWTVAHQASLSMGFSKQEYWSGLPFLLQGIFPVQELNTLLLLLLHCRQILYHCAIIEAPRSFLSEKYKCKRPVHVQNIFLSFFFTTFYDFFFHLQIFPCIQNCFPQQF